MGVAPIKMPQLGESVTEGTVDRWLKKEGDHVRKDEPLVEVVTDKVNAEIPSPFEGKLLKISVAEGTTIAIGTEIAQIEVEGAGAPTEPEPTASPEAQQAVPQQPVPPQPEADQAATGGAAPARSATGMRFSPAGRPPSLETARSWSGSTRSGARSPTAWSTPFRPSRTSGLCSRST